MSDIWQRQFHHGQLFDPANPVHAPDADPDGDAWSNRVEAIAGTDPFKRQPPDGIVQCTVSGPPDARVLSWPVVPGKRYTAQHSASLATDSWQAIAPAFTAKAGQTEVRLPVPPHLLATSAFFRIAVQDADDDLDGLTNYEELRYGTDPSKRWSLPGIGDYWLASHFADPATCDPAASPHGDGYTHSYYYQFNLDPEYQVGQQPSPTDAGYSPAPEDGDIGFETILNGDFISPQIGTGKRSDKASPKWDYWAEVPNWTAVNGKTADNKSYIEFQNHQDISGGVPYCELEAEPMSHTGIKQTIGVVPGKTYLITLDYRDRPSFQRPSGVDLAIDNLKQPLSDIETVDGWTKKLATFTAPQDKETVVIKITPPAGGTGFVKAIKLLPIEVKVVNRDDPTKTWTTGPVTSGPLAYTSPTISEVSDVKNGDLISWSLPGLIGGSFQWWATGPSGSRKDAPSSVTGNEWKLEDPLDWLPGKWRIHCRYTSSVGAATEFDFEQNLGYRSPDITVIGWIDGAQIILPSGADQPLLRTWPSGTYPSPLSVGTWMSTLPTRMTFLGEVALGDVYTVPLTPGPARKYVNAYLIKSSPNDAPPAEFLKQWPGLEGRKMVDSDALSDFVSDKKKFRSFHRFQARFELDDAGKIKGSPLYLKQKTQVGDTPVDWLPDPSGETGPHDGTVNTTGASIKFNPKNGKTHSAKLADGFEQYTQGRISTSGMMSGGHISKQVNNLKVPWIWSLIEFGAAHAKAGTTAVPEHEIFPVYHVYYNGKRLDTLTNSISEAKMEEFIQLGEPNVP